MKLIDILADSASKCETAREYKFVCDNETLYGWFCTNAEARQIAISFSEVKVVWNPNQRIIYER